MSNPVFYKLFISLAIVLFSYAASAETCFEASPNLQADEKTYFDLLMDKPLSSAEIKTVTRLTKALEGKWKGKAEAVECMGSIENPEVREISGKVTATAQKNTGTNLTIDAEVYIASTKVTKSTNLNLFETDNMFNVTFSGDKVIEYAERSRLKTVSGSRFLETINVIEVDGKNLHLKLNHYVNGDLVSYEQWTLKKTR